MIAVPARNVVNCEYLTLVRSPSSICFGVKQFTFVRGLMTNLNCIGTSAPPTSCVFAQGLKTERWFNHVKTHSGRMQATWFFGGNPTLILLHRKHVMVHHGALSDATCLSNPAHHFRQCDMSLFSAGLVPDAGMTRATSCKPLCTSQGMPADSVDASPSNCRPGEMAKSPTDNIPSM